MKNKAFPWTGVFLAVAMLSLLLGGDRSAGATDTGTPTVFLPLVVYKCPLLLFSDEFLGSKLDQTKWDAVKGSPVVDAGKLILSGGDTRTDIQSKDPNRFQYGVLEVAVESSDWKSWEQKTDSSFGFEIWTGVDEKCHQGVIMIANGHLGVLRSQPDENNKCEGQDPTYQEFPRILNWDAVRENGTVYLTLTWSPGVVTLFVSNGDAFGQASCLGQMPTGQLKVRLNADVGETYRVDSVRVYQEPQPQ